MPERRDLSIAKQIDDYVERIASLRQRASDQSRNTYTVALGQLVITGLISDAKYRAAIDRPRIPLERIS